MRQLIFIPCLFLFAACATVTADSHQTIHIITEPAEAHCVLSNSAGQWIIPQTPGSASVKRSFSPLSIHCAGMEGESDKTIEAGTRGRAYGNLLLFGLPALVDAASGDGYRYEPAEIQLILHPKAHEIAK